MNKSKFPFSAALTTSLVASLIFTGCGQGSIKIESVDDEVKNRTHIFDYAHHYQPCAFGKDEEWAEYFNLHNASLEQWKSKYHIDQYGINDYLKKAT